jgi:hypothetical protein
MGNRIIKGRNENYNLIKFSLNSASTNSEIYDKKIFNSSKLGDNKKKFKEINLIRLRLKKIILLIKNILIIIMRKNLKYIIKILLTFGKIKLLICRFFLLKAKNLKIFLQ